MVYMGSKDRNSKRNAPKERYNNLIRQRYSLLKYLLNCRIKRAFLYALFFI